MDKEVRRILAERTYKTPALQEKRCGTCGLCEMPKFDELRQECTIRKDPRGYFGVEVDDDYGVCDAWEANQDD